MEKTLVIIKPSAVQRGLIGDVISRFEKKGLKVSGIKMMQLDDAILSEHYSHLEGKPFYNRVKQSMMSSPVIVLCLEGLDVTNIVRKLIGITNGRDAAPGTIRGDFSVSAQENIVHASDSAESAETELKRFFSDSEIFMYNKIVEPFLYDLEDPIVKGK